MIEIIKKNPQPCLKIFGVRFPTQIYIDFKFFNNIFYRSIARADDHALRFKLLMIDAKRSFSPFYKLPDDYSYAII